VELNSGQRNVQTSGQIGAARHRITVGVSWNATGSLSTRRLLWCAVDCTNHGGDLNISPQNEKARWSTELKKNRLDFSKRLLWLLYGGLFGRRTTLLRLSDCSCLYLRRVDCTNSSTSN